jgi:hypothetical protein
MRKKERGLRRRFIFRNFKKDKKNSEMDRQLNRKTQLTEVQQVKSNLESKVFELFMRIFIIL